jgi:Fe-S cluster assembly ATP-binding protein
MSAPTWACSWLFQYPVAIPGVTVANFLRTAINSRRKPKTPKKGHAHSRVPPLAERKMDLLRWTMLLQGAI